MPGEQIEGVLVHETMHIAKEDFFRMGSRDSNIWNIASDCIINYILIYDEKFKLPKCALLPDKKGDIKLGGQTYNVKGKCTEELYEELYENAEKIPSFDWGHGGFDQHLPDDSDGQGGSTGEEDNENAAGASEASSQAEHTWKKIIIEAGTAARVRGDLPGSMDSIIDGILNPTIDWRTRILKFITNEIPIDYSNRRPGRTYYATGIWSPYTIRENLDVFIGIDVSGSTINDREYFMGEVSGILSTYDQIKARLIFWDANVNPKNDIEITASNRDALNDIPIADCNGGTRLTCYKEYCEESGYNCRLHIILTDGYIERNPEIPNGNTIFVLSKDGIDDYIKDLGAVCRITDIER
jgi:predicted metal-dependent peptidase